MNLQVDTENFISTHPFDLRPFDITRMGTMNGKNLYVFKYHRIFHDTYREFTPDEFSKECRKLKRSWMRIDEGNGKPFDMNRFRESQLYSLTKKKKRIKHITKIHSRLTKSALQKAGLPSHIVDNLPTATSRATCAIQVFMNIKTGEEYQRHTTSYLYKLNQD